MTIIKRAITVKSNGSKHWQDGLAGNIACSRTGTGTFSVTIPDKILGNNWACNVTCRHDAAATYIYPTFARVQRVGDTSTFTINTYYFSNLDFDSGFTLEIIFEQEPPYLGGVQPWIRNTLASWTFPVSGSSCANPDVGPNFTGSGGSNVAVANTGIIGDSRGMSNSSSPAYSNNASVNALKRIDQNPVFVQARVLANNGVASAQALMGAYSSSSARDWEFGIDSGGEIRVRMNNTATEVLSGLFLPADGAWHDICMQSDPNNQVMRFGLDGVIVTKAPTTGSWTSVNSNTYIGAMGAYQGRGWSGTCTQMRAVAETVLLPGATSYVPGDYQYLTSAP
jgi:hypothetical protein